MLQGPIAKKNGGAGGGGGGHSIIYDGAGGGGGDYSIIYDGYGGGGSCVGYYAIGGSGGAGGSGREDLVHHEKPVPAIHFFQCVYCGSPNALAETHCTQCGGPRRMDAG